MLNKRAQFFALYWVVITIVIMGMVILYDGRQQKNVQSSLVSPVEILELRDNLQKFEILEYRYFLESFDLAKTNEEWESQEFIEDFRKTFFSKISLDEEMKAFLLEDLYIEGNKVNLEEIDYSSFLENYLYPVGVGNNYFEGDEFVLNRKKIEKRFELNNGDPLKIKFPVQFTFEFDRRISINQDMEVRA